MRLKTVLVSAVALLLISSGTVAAQSSEDEFVQRYIKKMEQKHTSKLSWISGYFSLNRINRDNDYNKFATYESGNFPGATWSWLDQGFAFGLDLGVVFKERFAWSLSGEYWLKLGEGLSGSYLYAPVGTSVDNPKSEIQVYGVSTGLQYYFYNHPRLARPFNGLALRAGGTVGLYQAKWDLWSQYSNLNLATNTSTGNNTTYKGTAPGYTFGLGADYPLGVFDLVMGADFSYLYLNFTNVAWYNGQDQEIVVTHTGDASGRVDLDLSGWTGKIAIKRFFSW